jgi:hypothetical protein
MIANKRPETKLAIRPYTETEKAWAAKYVETALKEPSKEELKTKKIDQIKEVTKVKIPEKIADKKEKIVILVAIAIIIVMGLFPPWTYTCKVGGFYSEKPMGYQFIFWPPTPEGDNPRYGIYLDFKRLFLQWFLVAISTFGALLWLKIKNKQINNSKVLLTKEEQKRIATGYLKNLKELGFQIKITPPKEFRRKNQLKKD